jgi:hypothetical protein
MRFITLTTLAVLMIPSLVACGAAGFKSSGGSVQSAASASLYSNSDNSIPQNDDSGSADAGDTGDDHPVLGQVKLPELKLSDAESFAKFADQMLAELGLKLQGIGGGGFSFSSGTVSTNLVFKCGVSGTIRLVSQASASASIGFTSITVSVGGGSGQMVFSQCKISQLGAAPLQLDGTLNLNSFSGMMHAALGLSTGINTIEASGDSSVSGNLLMSTGEVVKTCAISMDRSSEVDSTIDILKGFKASGAIVSAAHVQVCGFDFNRDFHLTY